MAARAQQLTQRATPAGRAGALRAALASVPAAAWLCALAALLNAGAWSLLTPPFHVPDEQAHYAYTEYFAQHGRPPVSRPIDTYSGSQGTVLTDLRWESIRFVPANSTIWSRFEQLRLERDMRLARERDGGNGGAMTFGGEPPLYYALQGIPYRLGAGGTVLQRLALMRLLSTMLAGVTVVLGFLFLRELLPGLPWSWTVGALGIAFQPLFAFVSSGVNSDALFYACSAAVFFLLARAFRRGLTARLAVATGGALAIGLLTKFNALGLVPGTTLALVALAIRDEHALRLRTLRLPALTLAIAAAAVLLEMTLNVAVWDRPAVGATTSAFALSGIDPTLSGALSYAWQFFLIPLPGSEAPIGGFPLWEAWFTGFVGLFGWIDTAFSTRSYQLALIAFAAVTALAGATLVAHRDAVRRRRLELIVYALLAGSFALFVATASYIVHVHTGQNIAQARYLLPLLPLYGGLLALAVRGAGPRRATVVGCVIVALAIAHDVFAQLLVVSRYYA